MPLPLPTAIATVSFFSVLWRRYLVRTSGLPSPHRFGDQQLLQSAPTKVVEPPIHTGYASLKGGASALIIKVHGARAVRFLHMRSPKLVSSVVLSGRQMFRMAPFDARAQFTLDWEVASMVPLAFPGTLCWKRPWGDISAGCRVS